MVEIFLTILSAVCWTAVYLILIRRGFRDKLITMPFVALALNIAWEALYGWADLGGLKGPTVQGVANAIWFLFDCGLLLVWLKFGVKEFPKKYKNWFLPWTLLILAIAALLQWIFLQHYGYDEAVRASAFLQNLLMSGLFIGLLASRGSKKGHSIFAAILKCVGTLAPTILLGFMAGNDFISLLGVGCFVLDIIYICLLLKAKK